MLDLVYHATATNAPLSGGAAECKMRSFQAAQPTQPGPGCIRIFRDIQGWQISYWHIHRYTDIYPHRRNHIYRHPDMSTDILRYTDIGNLISCDRLTYTEIDISRDISRYHWISFWHKDILGYTEMSFRSKDISGQVKLSYSIGYPRLSWVYVLPYIQFNSHARPIIIASNVGFDSGVPKAIRSHRSAIAVRPGLSSGLSILYPALHGFTKELGRLLIQGMSHECLGRG
jgi:hypothetical protein